MIALALGLMSLLVAIASFIILVWVSIAMFDDDPVMPFLVTAFWGSILWPIYRFVKGWRAETRAIRRAQEQLRRR